MSRESLATECWRISAGQTLMRHTPRALCVPALRSSIRSKAQHLSIRVGIASGLVVEVSPHCRRAVAETDAARRMMFAAREAASLPVRFSPALRDDAEAVLDLVYHEYTLRQGIGERPDPNEFAARFPDLVKPLMMQFGLDAAIPPSTNSG